LLAGVVSQAFGLAWAVAVAALLTFVSGLIAAVSLKPSIVGFFNLDTLPTRRLDVEE
jgi:hypothetical protein